MYGGGADGLGTHLIRAPGGKDTAFVWGLGAGIACSRWPSDFSGGVIAVFPGPLQKQYRLHDGGMGTEYNPLT